MRSLSIFFVPAVLLFVAPDASAQTSTPRKDGYELYIQCNAHHSSFNQGVCLGYLGGVIDLYRSLVDEPEFCVPDDAPLAAVQEAYVAAYESRSLVSGTGAEAAAVSVLRALYPCGAG